MRCLSLQTYLKDQEKEQIFIFAEFLTTALTSSYEMETQLLICERRKYGNETELKSIINKVELLQKQISNFRDKILNDK